MAKTDTPPHRMPFRTDAGKIASSKTSATANGTAIQRVQRGSKRPFGNTNGNRANPPPAIPYNSAATGLSAPVPSTTPSRMPNVRDNENSSATQSSDLRQKTSSATKRKPILLSRNGIEPVANSRERGRSM